ncbi:hypothetical protein CABS01_09700 [Colletotrichum abscissum]|uniref:uncharacterized protein n=1 Tax=Colletotrichum abscissum TaxID=1671311 RepID=UPI0027D6ABFD|nr:uncharacterized protein CABS01_09700 [Colletotrichum abscissum]KAK1500965.1 hypothetical protein CABS01_09700 [Colletotrichum abscissum]
MTTAVNPADLSASVSRHHVEPGELGTMLKRSLRCSVPPDAVEMQGRHGMANWSFHVVVVAVKSANDQYQWGGDVQTILPLHCQRSLLQQCFMK